MSGSCSPSGTQYSRPGPSQENVPTYRAHSCFFFRRISFDPFGRGENGDAIELRADVAHCFRQFYSLIQDVVRAASLRDVRSLNSDLLGETVDLREFLFGAERTGLAAARPVLMDLQRGQCFYCAKPVKSESSEVDHFIPWAKYPADLAHNLVLTDRMCNGRSATGCRISITSPDGPNAMVRMVARLAPH